MTEPEDADVRRGLETLRTIGILTTDTDLVVKSWDSTLERMTRIPADRARGRRLDELVPDLHDRVPLVLLREPLVSGSAQVLAPAIHKFLIPCDPLESSAEFDRMQQRVVIGALRDDDRAVGLVVSIEDVTARLDSERRLARQLLNVDPASRFVAVRRLAALEPIEGLGPLASAIGDEDWQVRRAAVRALGARQDATLVDAIVSAVREGHRNFSVLSSALQLLSATGVDVTDALIGLLRHEDADLRVQAALSLGTRRRPRAAAALIEALDDADANVRFHAIEALGKLEATGALDRLAAIAESRDFFLAFPAIEALVRINDPIVATRLAPLLSDPLLAGPAADALGHLGDEEAIGPLVGAINESTAPVGPLIDAVAGIHRRYQALFRGGEDIEDRVKRALAPAGVQRVVQELSGASGPTLRNTVLVVGWLRDPAIPPALARLLGSADSHREVVEALVRFGTSAVELLIAELGRGDKEIARSAAVALGRLGDKRAVPGLADLLADEDNRELWVTVATALARLGDGRAFEPLLSRLGDRDPAVRQAVVGALNSIGHPDMAGRIGAVLGHPNPLVRESAVKIAGYFGYPGCFDTLVAMCRDADEGVASAALEHLPYFDDFRVLHTLAEAVTNGSPRTRASAAKAIGSMSGPDALALLRRAVCDPEPWVRYFAVISLGRQADAASLPDLARLATSDSAPQVCAAAIEAVAAIGGNEAADILEPLIAHEDADRRHLAVRAIGRVPSPRVTVILQEVLRSADPLRRLAAVEALAATRSPEAVEPLAWTAAGDNERDVAHAAIAGLGALSKLDAPVGRQALRALVACLSEPTVGADAIDQLAQLAPANIPWLAEELDADNPEVRRGVIEALGRLAHPAASARLQRALTDGDAVVRRQAIAALSRIGAPGLARTLAKLAQTDPSPLVRQVASAALERQGAVEGAE